MTQTESSAQTAGATGGARRGRLTVFVAAAPGAGKTYAMLEEGHRLDAEGKDVVIGLVEAYGRPRTVGEIGDLEVVPRRVLRYKGRELEELDVDAVIARHPQVALVDEIYHANVPGTRNEHRWEDVEELRAAGIDVLSTMNIQHLESLKDVAEQISGMQIRETIPDRLLEDADEIQLVDISPEALRKRMKHGNIYPQANVERALEGFFRPGNLAALRELALNWLANAESSRAEADVELPKENVMAAVREPLASQGLIRRALRLSRRYGGRCTVVTVLRPGESLSDELEQAQHLATALDAGFEILAGGDAGSVLAEAVRAQNARHLVVGAPGSRFLERYRGTLIDTLLEELKDVDLHIIASQGPAAEGKGREGVIEAESGEEARAEPAGGEGGEQGYLRVYLGYAPGTGTTAAMLREGQRRAGRGTRVVVGAVATYQLPANLEALERLEVIPPRTAPSRPGGPADMDLDAVLASGAQVVCVDDVAYTNQAPDARFRRRYEEIAELRRRGFKVITTCDLHSVESVAPRVRAETGVERQNLVPDGVLKGATELEVVDVPPAALIDRLRRGESGVPPDRAARLREVYTLEVLSHLRELALRLVAAHTDARLTAYMDLTGITAPWESMPRVMACVAPQPGLEPLIEHTARETRRLEGKLVVVTVDTGDSKHPRDAEAVARYRELTMRRGGQFVELRSPRPAQALLEYARGHHVTQIVITRGDHGGVFSSSIKRELIRGASQIDVHVLRELHAEASARSGERGSG
jgi:two-component system sensor histidine kinase KdpD